MLYYKKLNQLSQPRFKNKKLNKLHDMANVINCKRYISPSLESVKRLSIRMTEYSSNALMSGGSIDLRVLFRKKEKDVAALWMNRPFSCMLSTWNREGEKSGNSNSLFL